MKMEGDAYLEMAEGPVRAKLLGAFYTPDSTAATLARWAIRSGRETILEPSAGNGSLIKAAIARASAISPDARCTILAFDIDPLAIRDLEAQCFDSTTVVQGDFLSQDPASHPQVELVLANPPFIRNHAIAPDARNALRQRFRIEGAAGIWAHFLLHAIDFLRPGGRIASIVPRSAVFTRHGDALMRRLSEQFASIGVYELGSRPTWSTTAEEVGAVILAEGYKAGRTSAYQRGHINHDGAPIQRDPRTAPEYDEIGSSCVDLGQLASLSIGAVTGRNSVFLLSEGERVAARIGRDHVVPIVSRAAQLSGVTVTKRELLTLARGGHKTWLLRPKSLTHAISRYLSVVPESDLDSVVWFKKRDPWWLVDTGSHCDAVFTYMNDRGPRISLVQQGVVCTNTLHRVTFGPDLSAEARSAIILTPLSTFGQLAAEKIGRTYGGGVLKFELREARRLPVLHENQSLTPSLLRRVDQALRTHSVETARLLIDEAFMPAIFGASWREAQSVLFSELHAIRRNRRISDAAKEP